MVGMTWFAIGVATFLGTCAAGYIWAMNHFGHPDEKPRRPPTR